MRFYFLIFSGSTTNLACRTDKLEYTIGKLMEVAKELQDSKKAIDDTSVSRSKKFGKRWETFVVLFWLFKRWTFNKFFINSRSTSIDNDSGRGSTPSRGKPSLKRKSLSLEQTAGKNDQVKFQTKIKIDSTLMIIFFLYLFKHCECRILFLVWFCVFAVINGMIIAPWKLENWLFLCS